MGPTFTQVVAVNNLLALKDFTTFLFNYQLHDKPTFVSRFLITAAKKWIDIRAQKEMKELRDTKLEELSMNLNDCKTGMFTVLYLACQRETVFGSGQDIFQSISTMELEFEKLKHPKVSESYQK